MLDQNMVLIFIIFCTSYKYKNIFRLNFDKFYILIAYYDVMFNKDTNQLYIAFNIKFYY